MRMCSCMKSFVCMGDVYEKTKEERKKEERKKKETVFIEVS